MTKERRLRVGLIGTGAIALEQHVPAWIGHGQVELVGAFDLSPAARDAAAKLIPGIRLHNELAPLLADNSLDAVDICVPSGLHAEVAIAALDAGKHVLCEKPMATSYTDAVRMLAASERNSRKLMIAQHFRFEPSALALHAFLEGGQAGKIYYARGQWMRRRRLPARLGFTERRLSGGGALYDIGVHMLDLAWWLMDCPPPLRASGVTHQELSRRADLGSEWGQWDAARIDVEDFGYGMIRFAEGAALSLEVSWLAFQAENELTRLQLLGTRLGADWPALRVHGEYERRPWDLQLAAPRGLRGHHATIHAFADALLHDRPVPIDPRQSATVIAMLDALYRSQESGCEVAVESASDVGDVNRGA